MHSVHCPTCGFANQQNARFCGDCGAFLRDDTTRYLCAAVHRDADFCRRVLDEYTVEPVRALPPSPGVNVPAVLRDALASRARRRVRDAVLTVLFALLLFVSPGVFAAWAVLAVVLRLVRRFGYWRSPVVVTGAVIAGLVLGTALGATVYGLVYSFAEFVAYFGGSFGSGLAQMVLALRNGYIAVVLVALLAAVFTVDAYQVGRLTRDRFRRTRFRPDPRVHGVEETERTLRTFGHAGRGSQIARIDAGVERRAEKGRVPLVVHRGFDPFVGAGILRAHEALAISLVARDKTVAAPAAVDVLELHDVIERNLTDLRRSSSLGPGGRLAALRIDQVVMASAEDVAEHADSPLAARVLPPLHPPHTDGAPYETVTEQEARGLAVAPEEWARYYRRYRVETWDRQLVLSTFVHVGADDRNLYLERVHCVLPPVDARFREIDHPVGVLRQLGRGLAGLALFPATIPDRIRQCWSARRLPQRHDELVPDRYGAGPSLREMAIGEEFRTYYQGTDVLRYGEIVDRVLLRSVGAHLETLGYSAVEFQEAFTQTINDFRGSHFSNSAVGPDAKVTNGPAPAAQTKGKR